jgi:flagellar hook-length control protein FliK
VGGIPPSAEPVRAQPVTVPAFEVAPPATPEAHGASREAALARGAQVPSMPGDAYANVRSQIANVSLSEGRTRVELTPRGLGDIEVDLRQEGGQLRVVLRVENPAVLASLRQDRDGIVAMLRDGGVDVGDGALGFESFDGHRSRGQPGPDGRGSTFGPGLPAWDAAEEAAGEGGAPSAPVARTAGSASRLDLIT